MDELRKKSIHDLRVIAQSFGIADIFEKTANILSQEIELKQQKIVKPVIELPSEPEYDVRLMTAKPYAKASMDSAIEILEPYIKMGLKLKFDEEHWYMDYQTRNDMGTIRMPLRHMLRAAQRLMG